jgi:hypothetical protein
MYATTESAAIHQYRLDPARFARVRRRMITGLVMVVPLLLAAVWYLDARLDKRRGLFDFVGLPAILGWVTYRQFQRERKKWNSLVLELRSDSLTRTLPDFPVLEIAPSDVTTIVESSVGVRVQTNSPRRTLFVSTDLLDYGDFRNRLAEWAPMAKIVQPRLSSRKFILSLASVLWCVLMFGGPLYLMYTPHRVLILPLGTAIFIGMAATILYYQNSPEVPTSFRKTSWILLLLPLLVTISRLIESR